MKVRPGVEQIISSIENHPEDWSYSQGSSTMVHKNGARVWVPYRESMGIWEDDSIINHRVFSEREKGLIWETVERYLDTGNTGELLLHDTAKSIETGG